MEISGGQDPPKTLPSEEKFDLIIIGAGIYGLYAAKTFTTICPTINLLVVDSLSSVGGVWSKDRVYPGFHIQHDSKFFEFPELLFEDVPDIEMKYNARGYLSASSWCQYFQVWVDKVGVMKYVRLNTTVQQVTRQTGEEYLWKCQIHDGTSLLSRKLLVTTGISSVPRYPDLDVSKFSGLLTHHRYFRERYEELVAENIQEVVVYGASKSSMDALIQFAEAGKKIKWIIRKEGRGPPWLLDLGGRRSHTFTMRILGVLFPSAHQDDGFTGLHHFFKRTFLGKAFQKYAYGAFAKLLLKGSGLDGPNVDERLAPVVPDHCRSPIWVYNTSGVDNYDTSLYDYLRSGQIEAIRDTITSLKGNEITLASGATLMADAVVFATGFEPHYPFFSGDLAMRIGLPSTSYTEEYLQKWTQLETEADKTVYKLNPILRLAPMPPLHYLLNPQSGKLRLYHYIIPTDPEFLDGSLAILGPFTAPSTLQSAMVTSLWAAVYMLGKMELPSQDEMEKTAAYELRTQQIKHPGMFNDLPLLSFDFVAYSTIMLKQLGLNPWRKGGWFNELIDPYSCQDYGDLAKEWVEKNGIVVNSGSEVDPSAPR
ncbi:hypothetical protein TWF281_007976 [Arthrobotrys megalospora]